MGSQAPLLPTFASLTKKVGFRRQPPGLESRCECGLKELHNSRNEDKNGPSLVGETVHHNYSMDKRRKEDGKQKIVEGAREKDVRYAHGKRFAAESSAFKKRQKSTSKTCSLSSSEPSLWKNSLFNKFRNFAWHKRRSSHFELSNCVDYAACDPWSLGRLQRPAVGSCVDMKSRPDVCPQPQGSGKDKFPSQPSEMDSVWSDLVPSTSLDALHFWVDKSFSISHSSLECPTAFKIEEEETSEAPKSFSENILEVHLKSEMSLLSIRNSENLSDSTGPRKSGHFGKGTRLKSVMAGPHVQWPPGVAEDAKITPTKNPSIIRYEIMITMIKSEEEDVEAKPTASCGEQSSLCHSSGKAALSLGVAELEKTEGQRHQKPARPASRLSACKEFQNCNRLHGVETCQVCSLIATPATKSLAVPRGLESSPREGAQQNGADPGHSQNGTLVEGKGNIALETLANSKTRGAPWEGSQEQLQPQSGADTEKDLPCPNSNMEKVAGKARSHPSKPGDPATSPSLRWKKTPPEAVKKTPFGKVSAASQRVEEEGTRASSPSKVSKLLEAWEKGLVGMDATSPAPSAETRPSRSPLPARRLLSPPEGANASHPTTSRNSLPCKVSSVNAKRCLSPANAKQSFSPTGRRKSTFSEEAKRSRSPDPWCPSGPTAENRRSQSPAEKRQPPPPAAKPQLPPALKAKPTHGSPSQKGSIRSRSPVGRKDTPSRMENHSISCPDDTEHSSSLAGSKSSYSVADMRRLYCGGSTTAASTVDTRRPSTLAESRNKSPSSNARSSPSPAVPKCSSPSLDRRYPSPPPDKGWYSSSTDARCPSPGEINCLPPPPDALLLSSSVDNWHSSSPADVGASSSLVDSRSFSPTATEGHSCSPSPQRNFTAHGPVFSQVYSRLPKPKCPVKKEMQDGVSTRVTESPGATHSPAAVHDPDDAGFQQESQDANTNGLQEQNLGLSRDSLNGTVSRKEGRMLNGDFPKMDAGSLKENNFPDALALQSLRESSPNTLHSIPFSGSLGRNYISSAPSPAFPDARCVFKPVQNAMGSSTVGRSHAQWYSGTMGNSTVVFRAQQQVIVPQPGCSTVYQVGRELVMSGSGNTSQSQREKPYAPSSNTTSALEETGPPQADLPNAKSPQRVHSSFPKSCIVSTPESQPENGMTHSQNANVRDAQGPRCVPAPSPDRTSNRDAAIAREGAVPFSATQRDGSLPSNSASQKPSNLFARSRSEQEQGMPTAGGLITNGPDQESSWLGVGKASLSAKRRNKCPSDTAEEIGISATSQPTSPGDHKARTQDDELKKEKISGKSPLIFALEQDTSPAGSHTSFSWPEPPSDLIRSISQTGEQEPEETGEMEHFVDTLRNMDSAELRKPSKALSRTPRPSTLGKHTVLPPIDENHIVPKSKVSFPITLGELFSLTEKNSEGGKGSKGEEPGLAEEDTEEIENPYLTKEEKSCDSSAGRRSSSWESQQYNTEEDSGPPFLGKVQESLANIKANDIAPKTIVNHQPNLTRTNVLSGMALLSNFVDRKVVEDKPYSRLDNSFLYSKFISPEKAEPKSLTKKKEMSPVIQRKSSQTAPNAHQQVAAPKGLPLTALHGGHHFKTPDTSGGSKQIILLRSRETESLTQSEIQEEEHNPVKINKRPSKIILYSEAGFGGQKREIWNDVPDATSWELANTISIQVIRGGWLMYEKPRFHGRKCVLAEGNVEISNPWRMYCKEESEGDNAPFRIGSLKRVVQDFRLPEITFFAEENGEGRKQRFTDSAEDLRTCGQPLKAASIIVHSGLWLVYSKPFFDDDPYVLEPGGYPSLQAWGAKDPSICSMHPIKLGSPVVETPAEPKALIFERPHFQGRSWEVSRDIYNLRKPENNQDSMMSTAGSLKILGGCWVGYEKEGFRGHQYLLEEGEYCDWTDWAGYNEELLSLRLIRTDFVDPAIVLFEAMDFEDGPSVELSEALPDVELAKYGIMTQSIHVLNGVWVAYEGKNFSGEQYILEKGVYRNCEDWGATSCQIASVQPVLQVGERSLFFISKIQLFSEPDFSGNSMTFKEDQPTLPENFIPHSCRVNGGSWILYDGHQFDGEQHILSEGEYPTLSSMGCAFTTAICSLKKIPIFFSEPSIFLHGLECFEGKEIELNSEVRSLKAEGFNNHVLSVRVKGGIWALCEHSDFRGRQWVLECTEITNWLTYSGVQHIGSLYPIKQRRVYFRLKNQELKSFLSVPDDVEDMKAGRVLVSEINDQNSCIWYYEEGLMKNQVAPNMSLQVIGAAAKGIKVVLWSESRMPRQTWRIDSSGRICSQMFEDKVLDVKGGRTYDQDHAVLWDSSEERPTQIWDVQVM